MAMVQCVNDQGQIVGEVELSRAPVVGEFIELIGPHGDPSYIWIVERVVHAPYAGAREEAEVRVGVRAQGHVLHGDNSRGGMEWA